MSNDITGNPFILDTAADNIVAPTITLRPKLIVYSGADTAADAVQIEDGNEIVKFVLSVGAVGDTVVVPVPDSFSMAGLSLGAIGGGKVYLYF